MNSVQEVSDISHKGKDIHSTMAWGILPIVLCVSAERVGTSKVWAMREIIIIVITFSYQTSPKKTIKYLIPMCTCIIIISSMNNSYTMS